MSLIRKHVAVLQAWACLDLVLATSRSGFDGGVQHCCSYICRETSTHSVHRSSPSLT